MAKIATYANVKYVLSLGFMNMHWWHQMCLLTWFKDLGETMKMWYNSGVLLALNCTKKNILLALSLTFGQCGGNRKVIDE